MIPSQRRYERQARTITEKGSKEHARKTSYTYFAN